MSDITNKKAVQIFQITSPGLLRINKTKEEEVEDQRGPLWVVMIPIHLEIRCKSTDTNLRPCRLIL